MTYTAIASHRVLAIAPRSRGFGFIVMEGKRTPVDWGIRTSRNPSISREVTMVDRVEDLMARYRPYCILLVKTDRNSRYGDRVRLFLETIHNLATWKRIRVRRVSAGRRRKIFHTFGARTKYETALVVAQHLPELWSRLPPPRKPWMPEDHRMAIFDAAALALAYFYGRPLRRMPMSLNNRLLEVRPINS